MHSIRTEGRIHAGPNIGIIIYSVDSLLIGLVGFLQEVEVVYRRDWMARFALLWNPY